MKTTRLSNGYLSAFCLELSLLLHAGITVTDGLHLLADDDDDADSRQILTQLAAVTDNGQPLSEALAQCGRFPEYLIKMASIGEQAGRSEEVFSALSEYYDGQERLAASLRSALLYPGILLLLMLGVIGVLLVKVLPVFNDVFRQLGAEMNGLAGGLLSVGRGLNAALPALGIVLALLVLTLAVLALSPRLRAQAVRLWFGWSGDRGLLTQTASARFAAALALALKSGLNLEDALRMAAALADYTPQLRRRHEQCLQLLANGTGLAEALNQARVFPAVYCRMLSLGVKSGSADTVMSELARRMEDQVTQDISERVSRIEPTLVIISSLLIGAIIISVMLPLMDVMSAIG